MNKLKTVSLLGLIVIGNLSYGDESKLNIPEALMYQGKPIAPICFGLLNELRGQISLPQCSKNVDNFKITGKNKKLISEGYYGFDYQDNEFKQDMFAYYKLVAANLDSYILDVKYSGGGSGVFSSLLLINRRDNQLNYEYLDGGDRCNGEISDINTADNYFEYHTMMTPQGLITLANQQFSLELDNKALASSAVDCAAQAIYRRSLTEPTKKELLAVSLLKNYSDAYKKTPQAGLSNNQVCYLKLVDQYASQGKVQLSMQDFKAFAQQYNTQCVKK